MRPPEKIICAAIWYKNKMHKPVFNPRNVNYGIVFCGHRHGHCISQAAAVFYPKGTHPNKIIYYFQNQRRLHFIRNHVQGFLTNHNRFVDRKEGMLIATDQNQLLKPSTHKELYSEDLY